MRVIIDLDDKYSTVLSFTAIGNGFNTNVTVCCVDLKMGNKIKVDTNGNFKQLKEDD